MVNLRKLADTARKVVDKSGDKIAHGVDKATDVVDKKTKGKYTDKLNKIDAMAEKLDKTKPDEPEPAAAPEAAPEAETPPA